MVFGKTGNKYYAYHWANPVPLRDSQIKPQAAASAQAAHTKHFQYRLQ